MLNHNEIIRIAQELEPLPPSCSRLAALAADECPDVLEVIEIFRQDPVLTGKLLKLANSVAFGAPRTIGTVKEAVLRLGTTSVFGLAVSIASRPKLETRVPAYDLQSGALWRHSLTAALSTGVLTMRLSGRVPPLAFTSALLHDIGKLILGPMITTDLLAGLEHAVEGAGLLPFQAESEILSVHHGEVAGIIAQAWQLPEGIVRGVTHHHDPQATDDPHAVFTFMANIVARKCEGGEILSFAELEMLTAALEQLGLSELDLKGVVRATTDRLAELGPIYR